LHDVAVIGGGPVGSHVAAGLAGAGYRVVVLEKKARLDEAVCCTGIVGKECVRALAIDESVIRHWVNGARVLSPSGKRLDLWRPEPQACVLDRAAFNLAMARRAQAQGAEYVLNSRVSRVAVMADRVRIEVGRRGSSSGFLEARVVVVAAGAGSRLVAGLGLGEVGGWARGVQVEVSTVGVEGVEVYLGQGLAPGFFAWLVPTSPQRAFIGLISRRHPAAYLEKLMASLGEQGKITAADAGPHYGVVPLKPMTKTFGDRLIVVGSAAGQVKPITGGGIYYGVLCADAAVLTLSRALEGDNLSARNLAGYQKEWRRKLGNEIRVSYRARRFYERLGDSQIDRIIDIVIANGIDQALLQAEDLSFDWHAEAVLRLLGHRAFTVVAKLVRLPLYLRRRGKMGDSWKYG